MFVKKNFYAIIISLILILTFVCGCTQKNNKQSAYKKVNDMLLNLKTYKCRAIVKYISNKNTNTYEMNQYCKLSGEYKIEITKPKNLCGIVTLFDGQNIYQKNSKFGSRVSVRNKNSLVQSEIFLTSFIKNYHKSLATNTCSANLNKTTYTVLDAEIPGNHPYFSSERLFVNNETLKPEELIIYDKENSKRVIVIFEEFEYNINFDDTVFKIN
jgi:outer membrane lipoprotein-sorting protein